MIKSPRELEAYRTAGTLVSNALTSAMEAMIAGERACEAAARAAAVIMRGGGGFHRISICRGAAMMKSPLSYDFYGYNMNAAETGDLFTVWIYGPILRNERASQAGYGPRGRGVPETPGRRCHRVRK